MAPRPRPGAASLLYKEQRELEALPAHIDLLEQEQSTLHARINSADFYKEDATAIAAALDRVRDVDAALIDALARWDELESRSDRN